MCYSLLKTLSRGTFRRPGLLILGILSKMRPEFPRVFPAAALAAGLILSGGCSSSPGAGGAAAPAVSINDQEIPYADFEAYLKANFGEDLPPRDEAETRSRLLDQFIEERLLLQLAEKRKIEIPDEKVTAYLAGLGAGTEAGPGGKPVDAGFREQVRRNLLIQEFKDHVLLKEIRVAPEEVDAYYREHPQEFREARAVILRQILLEDEAEAKRILSIVKTDPGQFQVLAERHSASPDRGQPRPYEEQDLPESIRAMVFALSPGQISDVVEEGGKYRIFQAVDKHEGKNLGLEEVRKKIEGTLLQRKAEEALARAMTELKSTARIRVQRRNLPFSYRGDYGG